MLAAGSRLVRDRRSARRTAAWGIADASSSATSRVVGTIGTGRVSTAIVKSPVMADEVPTSLLSPRMAVPRVNVADVAAGTLGVVAALFVAQLIVDSRRSTLEEDPSLGDEGDDDTL